MRRISFEVKGELPPKKRPRSEIQKARLNALRDKAREALRSQANDVPFARDVRLTLSVHIGLEDDRKKGKWGPGDLDNFVAGVCDGLKEEHSARFGISDDSKVVRIDAKKVVGPDPESWYVVVLEGE
jgi:Holliday junction resolvase RusA-like endonuclease